MDRVVDSVEELGDLVNAEKGVGVEDERDNDLARSEPASVEGRVPCVGEGVAARDTPDLGTVVPDWMVVSPHSGHSSQLSTTPSGDVFQTGSTTPNKNRK